MPTIADDLSASSNCSGFDRWVMSPVWIMKCGLVRQRVDLRSTVSFEGAERVGIGRLVEADMAVAELDEGGTGGLGRGGLGRAEQAGRARYAAAYGPDHAGADPGRAFQQAAPVHDAVVLIFGHASLRP